MNRHEEAYNPFANPLVQPVDNPEMVDKFTKGDKDDPDSFITMLYFNSIEEATDWAQTYAKCVRHGLKEWAAYFMRIARARCAVKGHRVAIALQAGTRIVVPEFLGGKTYQEPRRRSKSDNPAESSNV